MIGGKAKRPVETNRRQGRNAVFEILDAVDTDLTFV
jgi:hypothetical protein